MHILREMELFLIICVTTFAYCSGLNDVCGEVTFYHFILSSTKQNASPLSALVVKAFNRSREIILMCWRADESRLQSSDYTRCHWAHLSPGQTPPWTGPCFSSIKSCLTSPGLWCGHVCYSKGLWSVLVSTRGVLSFKWKAALVFLIDQRKTGWSMRCL